MTQSQLHASLPSIVFKQLRKQCISESIQARTPVIWSLPPIKPRYFHTIHITMRVVDFVYTYATNLAIFILVNF
jgi:hypothetical protein